MSRLSMTIVALVLAALLLPALSTSQYKVTSAHKTQTSETIHLQYTGKDDYYIKPSSPISKQLIFTFKMLTFNDFTFKIVDANKKRFQVPQNGAFPNDPLGNFSFPISLAGVKFEYTENPFDFKITRRWTEAVLFSTYDQNITFSDHYLEIGTEIASDFVYGLGERFQDGMRRKDGKWTVFNRDRGQVIDKGQGLQTYGYYPFYMVRETQRYNLFHINYFRSSNAMDVIKSRSNGKVYITYKVIGGVLDFRFVLGEETPEFDVGKMHYLSGRSELPPFWSLGYHQSRWGYKSADILLDVLANFEKNGLPIDTIWSDIDYMIDYEDFTIDEARFPLYKMKNITDRYKWIPIIDAGIKTDGFAHQEGLKRGVFINDASGRKPYIGKVWPGNTTFVDFFHPNATKYWKDMLDILYQKVKFSGVWLDMNELANFCDGACWPSSDPSTFDYSKDLPYQPGSDNIESHTISLNATHYGNLTEADVHAFAAFLQTFATHEFLTNKTLRPFIISRSSTLGSGKYGYHWTGDNYASWQFLKSSIADCLINQIYGFSMVGPDICGFGGNTTEELCSRWYQLGTLYTFARNHNSIDSISQQPYALGPTVLAAAKTSLKLRYSILKQLYWVFVSNRGLGTIWAPMFFDFSFDPNAYLDDVADTQFLIYPNLLAAPVVEQNTTRRKVYFPAYSYWFDFYSGKMYEPGTHLITNAVTDPVPLFIVEGSMFFVQDTEKVMNTKQLDNTFIIKMGLFYEQYVSNSTHAYYSSEGIILAAKDYANDTELDYCFRESCDYFFNAIVEISAHEKHVELDVIYLGGMHLNQEIFISDIQLFSQDFTTNVKLAKPLSITGERRAVIPITSGDIPEKITPHAHPRSRHHKKNLRLD